MPTCDLELRGNRFEAVSPSTSMDFNEPDRGIMEIVISPKANSIYEKNGRNGLLLLARADQNPSEIGVSSRSSSSRAYFSLALPNSLVNLLGWRDKQERRRPAEVPAKFQDEEVAWV
ncbi:hypothetical protein V1477_011307 [Vespula maculifrons]|uniref:Uncharacterized protein n=1 Tax=Vespula maculifrons TaxID=7453 RepID=A0ABD2C4E5_VESMC